MVSEFTDFFRISRSSLAQLIRYTAWNRHAFTTFEASKASRYAATSSSWYSRTRHARGFWLKNWIAWAPRSSPRPTAFAGPPAGDTWAPTSIRSSP